MLVVRTDSGFAVAEPGLCVLPSCALTASTTTVQQISSVTESIAKLVLRHWLSFLSQVRKVYRLFVVVITHLINNNPELWDLCRLLQTEQHQNLYDALLQWHRPLL